MSIVFAAGVCLAVYFLAETGVAVLLMVLAPPAKPWIAKLAPPTRARVLFLGGIGPSMVAAVMTFGIALPAFLLFEPPWAGEKVGVQLPMLAGGGLILLGIAVARVAYLQWCTWRVARAWNHAAKPLQVDAACSASEVVTDDALLSTVGVLRPQVYASRAMLAALSPNELRAALAHEVGHVRAGDNLKRLLLQALPASRLLGHVLPLQREWRRACELSADEAALRGGASCVDLASALVKAGRLRLSSQAAHLAAASHLVAPAAASEIEERVRRLIADPIPQVPRSRAISWAYALGGGTLLAYFIYFLPLMHSAHELLERLVR